MRGQQTFTATEARQNFFKLLQSVAEGFEAIVVKADTGVRYKITLSSPAKQSQKKLAQQWDRLSLKTKPWDELKKIMIQRHDLKI